MAVLLVVGAVAWYFQPPTYEAFALLKIEHDAPSVLADPEEVNRDDFALEKRTNASLVTSGTVLRAALRMPTIASMAMIKLHEPNPEAWLAHQIVVDYPNDSEIMRVTMRGENREELVKLVDAVVSKYLSEVVQRSRDERFAREDMLKKKYDSIVQDFKRRSEAVHKMEQSQRSSNTAAGEIRRKLALAELDDAISMRNFLRRELLENQLQIRLHRLRQSEPVEAQTAESEVLDETASDVPPAPGGKNRTADVLEQQRVFLQEKIVLAEDRIREAAESFDDLESHSASIAAQHEELVALKTLMNALRSKIDRTEVERLSQERVQLLDNASAVPSQGRQVLRSAVLAGAVLLSVGLVIVGWASGRPKRWPSTSAAT
jgi:capsular polysaccharide biosynthesis protein